MGEADATPDLTRLLQRAAERDDGWREVWPVVLEELHVIADARMARERAGHTLQATALVHEAWMRLARDTDIEWTSRRHFYGAAARAMERVLVDHARAVQARKRGGEHARVSITFDGLATDAEPERVLELHDAFDVLEREDARTAEVARLRVFAGLEFGDIARSLALSERTVMREWSYARARLEQLHSGGDAAPRQP